MPRIFSVDYILFLIRMRFPRAWKIIMFSGVVFLAGVLFFPQFMPYEPYAVWLRSPDFASLGMKIVLWFYAIDMVSVVLDVFWWKLRPVGQYTFDSCVKAGFREDPIYNWMLPVALSLLIAVVDSITGNWLQGTLDQYMPTIRTLVPAATSSGWAMIPALVVSGLIFWYGHYDPADTTLVKVLMFIEITLAGIMMSMCVASQGIWFCMIAHSLYDIYHYGVEVLAIKLKIRTVPPVKTFEE